MKGCIYRNVQVKFAVYQTTTDPLLFIKSTVYLTFPINATILRRMKAWLINNEILKRRWTRMWPIMRDLPGNYMEVWRELQRSSEGIVRVRQNSDLASPENISDFTAGASLTCAKVMNTRSYTSSPAYVFILSCWRKHEDRFITAAGVLSCTSASEGCISKSAFVEITGQITKDPYFLSRKQRIPALPQRHFGKHLFVCHVRSLVFSDVHWDHTL
jgi:hypothetical protein